MRLCANKGIGVAVGCTALGFGAGALLCTVLPSSVMVFVASATVVCAGVAIIVFR